MRSKGVNPGVNGWGAGILVERLGGVDNIKRKQESIGCRSVGRRLRNQPNQSCEDSCLMMGRGGGDF